MKYRMIENWQEEGRSGPKKGDILDLSKSEEVFDDQGHLEMWFVEYEGEHFEVYPYEVEELKC